MWPDWRGCTAVIVASGPSAKEVTLELAHGKAKFIAINESHRLAPWSDILYACDGAWWRLHKGLPDFGGLRLTEDQRASDEFCIQRVKIAKGCDQLLFQEVGTVGDGGNSGFQALNLALQFGASSILLVGYDMSLANGEHWHGRHPAGLNNPKAHNVSRWLGAKWTIPDGTEILNCSHVSSLTAYPKQDFETALGIGRPNARVASEECHPVS